jgi:hypothetical protein
MGVTLSADQTSRRAETKNTPSPRPSSETR